MQCLRKMTEIGVLIKLTLCRSYSRKPWCVFGVNFSSRHKNWSNLLKANELFWALWSFRGIKSLFNKTMRLLLMELLYRLDRLTLIGGYEVWIYNNYVSFCVSFLLNVDNCTEALVNGARTYGQQIYRQVVQATTVHKLGRILPPQRS